nr:NKG2-A/NKG2-B type II integral membrane protein-like isoform X3 [Loxodonta africana]
MNNQTVTYSELNLAKNPKRQQIKPTDSDRSISITEQEITYVELNFHGASQDLQKNDKNFHCKGILISIIIAMIFLAIGTKKENPTQKASHCGHCPEDWLSYSNNCYYISSDKKNWTESQMACASKKSDLTYIDNEEEMKFMNFLPSSSWIGLSRESRNYPWFWINGSPSNQNITEASGPAYNCGMLFSFGLQSASCGAAKVYICKLEISSLNT